MPTWWLHGGDRVSVTARTRPGVPCTLSLLWINSGWSGWTGLEPTTIGTRTANAAGIARWGWTVNPPRDRDEADVTVTCRDGDLSGDGVTAFWVVPSGFEPSATLPPELLGTWVLDWAYPSVTFVIGPCSLGERCGSLIEADQPACRFPLVFYRNSAPGVFTLSAGEDDTAGCDEGWGTGLRFVPTAEGTVRLSTRDGLGVVLHRASPAPTPASCVSLSVYTVVAGDTLWEISQRYGVPVESLLAANPQITDRRLIRPGDEITIPPQAIELETPDGYGSVAWDINDNGQIVGQVQSPSGATHASLWRDGAMVDLGTLGGAPSYTHGINDAGHIIGGTSTASNAGRSFLWRDGVMTNLGTLGGVMAAGLLGINDRDQVVGEASTIGGEQHAFLWENGVMKDLGTLGGTWSSANGVNERGQVVGASTLIGDYSDNPHHAFLWEDGVMTDLGTLGGTSSVASAINDRGQIVGWSHAVSGDQHAFLWEDGVMTDLGTLRGGASSATDINECGQVVGWDLAPGGEQAFLWANGQMVSLSSPIRDPGFAYGINDQGQIVGYWVDTAPGVPHALLWQIACGCG